METLQNGARIGSEIICQSRQLIQLYTLHGIRPQDLVGWRAAVIGGLDQIGVDRLVEAGMYQCGVTPKQVSGWFVTQNHKEIFSVFSRERLERRCRFGQGGLR